VGAAVAAYLTALPNGFISDAKALIVDNPSLLKSDEWLAWFTRPYFWGSYVLGNILYRPLSVLSYVATVRVAGVSPLPFVLGNIALHAAASWLVFLLGRRLIGAPAAWLGALLFAVHPLHVEAVAWVGGRPDVLSAALAMGSALYFLRATDAGARHPGLFALLSVALYFAALLSKEHVITLPAWFAVAWLIERDRRSARWAAVTLGGSAIALVLFAGMRFIAVPALVRGFVAFTALGSPWQLWRWLAGATVAGKYAALFVWPSALTFDYTDMSTAWAESRRVPPLDALLGVACVIGFVAAFGWALRRHRGLALVLAFIPVTYAVVSGFPFTPQLYMAERFTYLPSAGACLAVGWMFVRIGQSVAGTARAAPGPGSESAIPRWDAAGAPGRALAVVLVGVIAVLTVRTAVRNTDWRNEETLAVAALAVSPNSPLGLRTRGHQEYRRGNYESARLLFEESLKINPWRTDPYVVLGDIYLKQGNPGALLDLAVRAEARIAHRRELLHLGGLLWQIGRRQDAERLVRQVVTVYPDFVRSRLALGGFLLEGGRPEQALEQFRAASALEPQNGLAWLGMARASAVLGRLEDARLYADRARSAGLPGALPPSGGTQ
jgi:Tfp pilus assembly protein PilF